ncbi:hypothetical protein GCM10010377_29730 [Streptomyces viridiviolaceus]|nr:hypothetical protein GCM10010377_29730 [Streptomyces viridiviolaceus]
MLAVVAWCVRLRKRSVSARHLLAVAGINRYASLFEHAAYAHLHKDPLRESIGTILTTQVHDGKKAFTSAYFHSGAQLRDEVVAAGFEGADVFGIEGPAWSLLAAAERNTGQSFRDSDLFDSVLAAARMAESHPELLAAGSHLLAIGRRPA